MRGSGGVIPGLSAGEDQSPSSITEKESGFLLPAFCPIQALNGLDDAHPTHTERAICSIHCIHLDANLTLQHPQRHLQKQWLAKYPAQYLGTLCPSQTDT